MTTPPPPPPPSQPDGNPVPPPPPSVPAAPPPPPPAPSTPSTPPAPPMPPSAPPGIPPVPPGFPSAPAYAPEHATRRADAKVGGGLLILAGVIAIIGAFLAWVTVGDASGNGFDDYVYDGDMLEAPGALSVIGAAVLIGFGLALFFAGRVLAVAILATVAASVGVLLSAGVTVIMSDIADDYGGSLGIGAILQPVATLVGLAGAIASLVMRKRRPI